MSLDPLALLQQQLALLQAHHVKLRRRVDTCEGIIKVQAATIRRLEARVEAIERKLASRDMFAAAHDRPQPSDN